METRVVDKPEHSRFEILVDGRPAGFADYVLTNGVLTLPHTVVDPAYGGRGVGGTLVGAVLDVARDRGLLVQPLCSFVADYIAKHPEHADLVA